MTDGIVTLAADELIQDEQNPARDVVISFGDQPDFVPGRRAWVKYRELGVNSGAGGAMSAQVLHAGFSNENTGWHKHRCDVQFLYIIEGALTLAFSPTRIVRLTAGDSIMIPGGTAHQERGGPEGVVALEITVPGGMGTEPVAALWGDEPVDFERASDRVRI